MLLLFFFFFCCIENRNPAAGPRDTFSTNLWPHTRTHTPWPIGRCAKIVVAGKRETLLRVAPSATKCTFWKLPNCNFRSLIWFYSLRHRCHRCHRCHSMADANNETTRILKLAEMLWSFAHQLVRWRGQHTRSECNLNFCLCAGESSAGRPRGFHRVSLFTRVRTHRGTQKFATSRESSFRCTSNARGRPR